MPAAVMAIMQIVANNFLMVECLLLNYRGKIKH